VRAITFSRLGPEKGIPYCRDHLRKKVKDREFPAPIQLGSRRIAWLEDDVDRWLAERPAAGSASE
jgi:prophage regulatory protein